MLPSVRVEGLGKRFRLRSAGPRHNTLRDAVSHTLERGLRSVRQGFRKGARGGDEDFWALREVNFEVGRGEAVGIIGPNGAGKSTLLKILSRITPPSEGRVEVRGRVGSLLEVGTGFHSELSGRENTYLSGAILGMSRSEIDRKFDEIVDFAGVERFIETPVKHYSSGMYLRLAFAVAAHLEPDVLIVDEVLAVGDAEFQRKCLGKMEDVTTAEGRTVLFVSHNMSAVERLCGRCILLRGGQVQATGTPTEVVGTYLASADRESAPETWIDLTEVDRRATGGCRFRSIRYASGERGSGLFPYSEGPMSVELEVESEEPTLLSGLEVQIRGPEGERFVSADLSHLPEPMSVGAGVTRLEVRIDAVYLNPGRYTLGLWLQDHTGRSSDSISAALPFDLVPRPGRFRSQARTDAIAPCSFSVRKLPAR